MSWSGSSADFEWHDEQVTYSEGSWGSESRLAFVRRIRRKNGASLSMDTDANLMVLQGALPQILSRLNANLPNITRRLLDTMRAQEWSYRVEPGGKAIVANITYLSQYFVDGVVAGQQILPASCSYQTVTRVAKIYRTGWTTDPPNTSDSTTDIGGTAIQGVGATATMLVPQVRFRINIIQDASITAQRMNDVANFLSGFVGTRNSSNFGPFVAGLLLCEGFNLTQTRMPYYEVTADFLYDDWAHHEQVADVGIDGRPNYTTGGNLAAVFWKRPTLLTTNFNLIFGSPTPDLLFQNRVFRGFPST